jgi:EAL domain-containing protein (putative c-di-GMP-specific phosphodiesterase class I)
VKESPENPPVYRNETPPTYGDGFGSFIEDWRNPKGYRAAIAAAAIGPLIAGVGVLVYFTGGTVFVWAHLMYVPIILSAAAFRVPGGIVAGLAAGLVLGPLMPLHAPTGTAQETANWTFRIGFFVLIGSLTGLIAKWLNEQLDRTRRQSLTDLQTGLGNLLSLQKTLSGILSAKKGPRGSMLLAVLDIANAQEAINTLGYRSAGALVPQIVERLRAINIPSLSLFRLPGQRFAIMAEDGELHEFIAQCKQILRLFEKPLYYEAIPVVLNPYIGIAEPDEGATDPDNVIQKASVAAHTAATRGTLYSTYSKKDDATSVETLALLGSLNEAIKNSELELYFQPKIEIKNNRVEGAEALIRWVHPTKGLIRPDAFIPQAEKTWLVHPLSLFAVRRGLDQLKKWEGEGLDLTVAINLTANNMQDRSFISELIELVRDYRIDASKLEIEITERTLVTDMDAVREALNSLKNMGASVSIDDFGEGHAKIDLLEMLPIDALKIDQKFIKNLNSSRLSKSVVPRVIEIAKELNVKTVAEGIESEEILAKLKDLGCDMAQGYYISRPLSEEDFSAWLKSPPWKVRSSLNT